MIIEELLDVLYAEGVAARAFRGVQGSALSRLRGLIGRGWRTSFGREHGLRPGMSINEFRAAVPIRDYVGYGPWISRICAGEADVLWPGKPIALASTSGTTADNKYIPVTKEFLSDYHLGSVLTFTRISLKDPRILSGRILTLGGPSEEGCVGGIPVGSITGLLYSNLPKAFSSRLAFPPGVHNIGSYSEKLYVIARLTLETRVTGVIAMIPGSLLVVAEAISSMAGELIDEISEGTLRPLATAPKNLEAALRTRLRPNPKRAQELKRVMKKEGRLLPKRIWSVRGICTYTKQGHPSQWEAIREGYGDVNIIDPGLVASEGRVSVGLYPGEEWHAAIPLSGFLEFLPVELTGSSEVGDARTLLPHELEAGQLYSPVISSSNGLMRYRLEDVVRVVKRVRNVPLIEYVGRLDASLSVAGEKVCDLHFREVVSRLREEGHTVEGLWAVGIEWVGQKPRYLFLWETDRAAPDFNGRLEQALQDVNVSYRRKREQALLLPAKAVPVAVGGLLSHSVNLHWLGQSKNRHLFAEGNLAEEVAHMR